MAHDFYEENRLTRDLQRYDATHKLCDDVDCLSPGTDMRQIVPINSSGRPLLEDTFELRRNHCDGHRTNGRRLLGQRTHSFRRLVPSRGSCVNIRCSSLGVSCLFISISIAFPFSFQCRCPLFRLALHLPFLHSLLLLPLLLHALPTILSHLSTSFVRQRKS